MCQALRDGGRRCPIHKHQTVAVVRLATATHGLNRHQVEAVFRELRREGRGVPAVSPEYIAVWRQGFLLQAANESPELLTTITRDLALSDQYTEEIDGPTFYAQQHLDERVRTRGNALMGMIRQVAGVLGITEDEAKRRYDALYDAVDISRDSTVPPEYTDEAQRAARLQNRPDDRASVTALARLAAAVEAEVERERRITQWRQPAGRSRGLISQFGYDTDGGRLEVRLANGVTYAYHDVPERVWANLATSANALEVYARFIRGHEDYQYVDEAAAEADAYRTRCAACGQFRAVNHVCPELAAQESAEAQGVDPARYEELFGRFLTETRRADPDLTALPHDSVVPVGEAIEPAVDEDATQPVTERVLDNRLASITVPLPQQAASPIFNSSPAPVLTGSMEPFPLAASPMPATDFQPTPDSQFAPQAVTPVSIDVRPTMHGSAGFDAYIARGGADLSDDTPAVLREIVANAPTHMRFLINRPDRWTDSEATPALAWDSRNLHIRREGNRWAHRQPRIIAVAANGNDPYAQSGHDGLTAAQQREADTAARARLDEQIANDEIIYGIQNATATRRYVFDANLATQPAIRTASAVLIRNAIDLNQAVATDINIAFHEEALPGEFVDDQGYAIAHGGTAEVSGRVVFRRNAEGVIEMISDERTLRCQCATYRQYYRCQHLNYALRHMGNVYQQMLPDRIAAGRTMGAAAVTSDGTPVTHHALLTANLRSRGDTTVVTDDDGTAYIRSGARLATRNASRAAGRFDIAVNLRAPDRLNPADPDNPTPDELYAMHQYSLTVRRMDEFGVPRSMGPYRQALRRSDVELPVYASFRADWYARPQVEGGRVSGMIRYAQQADGNFPAVQVRSHTLRCDCAVYQRNSECEHTRTTLEQAHIGLNVGMTTVEPPARTWGNLRRTYESALVREGEIRAIMESPEGRSVRANRRRAVAEELHENAARLEQLRREREQREHAERLRQREREYQRQAQDEANRLRRANAEDIAHHDTYRSAQASRWASDVTGYGADIAGFYADYQAARDRKARGESPVPFRTENVTDGVCADVPGARRFGVELEFDIKPGVNKAQALAAIGRDLQAAGLTRSAEQQRYHAAVENSWARWSFERDSTVDAELVSPILADTPEHWGQLAQAVEIIKRHGGVTSKRTGSHVHVSTGSYESSAAKHIELLRTVNQYDDILYRMATNPDRGKHRGMEWCSPNVNDSLAEISAEMVAHHRLFDGNHQSHHVGVNFQATHNPNYGRSNVEFRMWDGTLDAAVIQQQVVLSAAITDYAERQVIEQEGVSKPRHEQRLTVGTAREREKALLDGTSARRADANLEQFTQVNGHVASFFDKLFRRAEDRAAATSLFAITAWQKVR